MSSSSVRCKYIIRFNEQKLNYQIYVHSGLYLGTTMVCRIGEIGAFVENMLMMRVRSIVCSKGFKRGTFLLKFPVFAS